MGHGKETPRQKMIGMMYLVLTALLALNVSADILKAFTKIDKSIRTSTESSQKKNEAIYSEFLKALTENENKVKPWNDKALEVKAKMDALFDKVQEYKLLLVTTADGPTGDPTNLIKKDDTNVGGQLMILEGRGEELKKMIEEEKEFLLSMLPDSSSSREAIESAMSTEDSETETGEIMPWAESTFEHLPLVAVITLMSKMQNDFRNAEAQVLAFLLGQIDAGSFKFNKLEAIVNAPTGYVLQGQPYEAQIFIAASDTTKDPKVVMNGGSELKVENGKAKYTGETSSLGIKTVAGKILVESPATGEILEFPFSTEYQVGAASVAVSPTKMNVFYIGVENPVDITASGVPADAVNATISSGSIKKDGKGGYIVEVKSGTEATITVTAKVGETVKTLGSKKFRIKTVPDPVAKVGGQRDGSMSKSVLLAQTFVKAEMENFDFELTYNVTGFTVSATIGGFTKEEVSASASITSAQKAIITEVKTGSKVYFEGIKAKGPDGTTRSLGTLSFKLN